MRAKGVTGTATAARDTRPVLYGIKDAAALLGISDYALRRRVKRGEIPHKMIEQKVYVRRDALEAAFEVSLAAPVVEVVPTPAPAPTPPARLPRHSLPAPAPGPPPEKQQAIAPEHLDLVLQQLERLHEDARRQLYNIERLVAPLRRLQGRL